MLAGQLAQEYPLNGEVGQGAETYGHKQQPDLFATGGRCIDPQFVKNDQWPMPEINAVADAPEPFGGPNREKSCRQGLGVVPSPIEYQGCAGGWKQGQQAGQGQGGTEQCEAHGQHRQSKRCAQFGGQAGGAERTRQQGRERADHELPEARRQAVIGGRRIKMRQDLRDGQRDQQQRQYDGQQRRCFAGQGEKPRHQHGIEQVKLHFDGQGPDVQQHIGLRVRGEIAALRLKIHIGGEGGRREQPTTKFRQLARQQQLISRHCDYGEHGKQRRNDASNAPRVKTGEREPT